MKTLIEESTGYASFLICDHKDMICFYRSGQEMAVYNKKDSTLKITPGMEARFGEYRERIESALAHLPA